MRKAADAFRSIGEVSKLIGVPPHVLRYWETQFPQLAPVKRADGRRYYRPEDLHLAAGLCELLREEGMTTRGAARLIARDKGAALRARGLARLPERFRGENGGVEAEEAGATHASSTEAMMTEATPVHEREDGGGDGGQLAAQAAEYAAGQRETATKAGQSVADIISREGIPVEPAAPAVPDGGTTPTAPDRDAAPAVERTAEPEATATAEAQVPEPEAAVTGPPARTAPGGEAPPAAAPARRPAPLAGDLPLFPGLAPAAPPPGVWLPRLAAAADALRAMTPPRRPSVQMQRLRDRIAALLDPDA